MDPRPDILDLHDCRRVLRAVVRRGGSDSGPPGAADLCRDWCGDGRGWLRPRQLHQLALVEHDGLLALLEQGREAAG